MGKARLENISARTRVRNQKGGRQPQDFTGGTALERLDMYNLILKLGQLGAYDSHRRIKGPNGEFVQNTDVAHLIDEAMRPSRVVNGADSFIDLLAACKVDPSIIVNDTLRSKLVKRIDQLRDEGNNDDASDEDTIIDEGPSNTSQTGHGRVPKRPKKYRLERIENISKQTNEVTTK